MNPQVGRMPRGKRKPVDYSTGFAESTGFVMGGKVMAENDGSLRARNQELAALLAVQATLLQREMITADLLRWKLLDAGLPIDCPPEIRHPRTGALPPGAELVVQEREEAEMEQDRKDRERKEQRQKMEIIKVPAVSEMEPGAFERHIELRHRVTMDEERHAIQHRTGLVPMAFS